MSSSSQTVYVIINWCMLSLIARKLIYVLYKMCSSKKIINEWENLWKFLKILNDKSF